MKFFTQAVQVHQLTAKEWGALQDAHEIIQEILREVEDNTYFLKVLGS
jgi:hypothetical protein